MSEPKMPTPEETIETIHARTKSENNEMKGQNYESDEKIREETEVIHQKIASVRELINHEPERHVKESEFVRAVEELVDREPEKEKGQIGMLRELWGITPGEVKMDLISDFIFNPNAIRQRYYTERSFQDNLKSKWKK